MLSIIFLSIIVVIFELNIYGQQKPMFTQYMSNLLPTNPAYAGTGGRFNVSLFAREQWVGYEGAPSSQMLIINSPILGHSFGVGLTIINDKVGPLQQTGAYIDFAFNFKIKNNLRLSMGLKSGFNFSIPKFDDVKLVEQNDPAFTDGIKGSFMPNFGFGVYLYSPQYYFGVTIPELFNNDMGKEGGASDIGSQKMHFFVIGGYVWTLSKNIKFKPSGLMKMVSGSPPSFDVTCNFILYDKLWLGVMYRIGDALGFIAQYQINDFFRVGYSFDLALTKMMKYNYGTHEIMISFELPYKTIRIKTPRYF